MNRTRTSKIWTIPKSEFQQLVSNSKSLAEILQKLSLGTGNYKSLKKRIKEDQISISHIALGLNSNKGKRLFKPSQSLQSILTINSSYSRGHLKRRLLKGGLLKNECYEWVHIGITNLFL